MVVGNSPTLPASVSHAPFGLAITRRENLIAVRTDSGQGPGREATTGEEPERVDMEAKSDRLPHE